MVSASRAMKQPGRSKRSSCSTLAVIGLHCSRDMAPQFVQESRESSPPEKQTRAVTELAISGMTCGNCARHVTEALQSVPGVRSAAVSLEGKSASVKWTPGAKHNKTAL